MLHLFITPSKEFHTLCLLCLADVNFDHDDFDQQQCLKLVWSNIPAGANVARVAGSAANLSEAIDLLVLM